MSLRLGNIRARVATVDYFREFRCRYDRGPAIFEKLFGTRFLAYLAT